METDYEGGMPNCSYRYPFPPEEDTISAYALLIDVSWKFQKNARKMIPKMRNYGSKSITGFDNIVCSFSKIQLRREFGNLGHKKIARKTPKNWQNFFALFSEI